MPPPAAIRSPIALPAASSGVTDRLPQPPCVNPPRVSSSAPPGPCITPSSVTWFITAIRPISRLLRLVPPPAPEQVFGVPCSEQAARQPAFRQTLGLNGRSGCRGVADHPADAVAV